MRLLLPIVLLSLLACASAGGAGGDPPPAPARSVPVTAENLLLRDEYWPFRVELIEPHTPEGASEPLPARPGVLVRVEPGGVARIDFARSGRHQVPVEATDLVERANRIRLGSETKPAPNLVLVLGNKLLGSTGDEVRPFPIPLDARLAALLCVFADPAAPGFEAVADALRPLTDREGVQSVLFPVGELRDGRVRQRLRRLGWPIPFVFDRFARPYADSIAGEGVELPHAMLLTPDGRVLWRGPASADVVRALDRATRVRARWAAGGP